MSPIARIHEAKAQETRFRESASSTAAPSDHEGSTGTGHGIFAQLMRAAFEHRATTSEGAEPQTSARNLARGRSAEGTATDSANDADASDVISSSSEVNAPGVTGSASTAASASGSANSSQDIGTASNTGSKAGFSRVLGGDAGRRASQAVQDGSSTSSSIGAQKKQTGSDAPQSAFSGATSGPEVGSAAADVTPAGAVAAGGNLPASTPDEKTQETRVAAGKAAETSPQGEVRPEGLPTQSSGAKNATGGFLPGQTNGAAQERSRGDSLADQPLPNLTGEHEVEIGEAKNAVVHGRGSGKTAADSGADGVWQADHHAMGSEKTGAANTGAKTSSGAAGASGQTSVPFNAGAGEGNSVTLAMQNSGASGIAGGSSNSGTSGNATSGDDGTAVSGNTATLSHSGGGATALSHSAGATAVQANPGIEVSAAGKEMPGTASQGGLSIPANIISRGVETSAAHAGLIAGGELIGTQGKGSADGVISGHNAAHSSGGAESTFLALDSASAEKGVLIHAGPRQLAVGVTDPALGWVEVRADRVEGQIAAALTAHSASSQVALHAALPAMTAYLQEQRAGVHQVQVQQAWAGNTGDTGAQGQGSGQRFGQGAGDSQATMGRSVEGIDTGRAAGTIPGGSTGSALPLGIARKDGHQVSVRA